MSASEMGKRLSERALEDAHLGVMNEANVTSRAGHGSSECALRGTNSHGLVKPLLASEVGNRLSKCALRGTNPHRVSEASEYRLSECALRGTRVPWVNESGVDIRSGLTRAEVMECGGTVVSLQLSM